MQSLHLGTYTKLHLKVFSFLGIEVRKEKKKTSVKVERDMAKPVAVFVLILHKKGFVIFLFLGFSKQPPNDKLTSLQPFAQGFICISFI